MRLISKLALVLLCAGACTPRLGGPSVRLPERCVVLDDRHQIAGGTAKGSAVLAGGAGVATLPYGDDSTGRIVIASTALGAAVVMAVSSYVSEAAAESYARDCLDK